MIPDGWEVFVSYLLLLLIPFVLLLLGLPLLLAEIVGGLAELPLPTP